MNANAIRTALVALLLAGGLSMACRLTGSAPKPEAASAQPKAAQVCKLGRSC